MDGYRHHLGAAPAMGVSVMLPDQLGVTWTALFSFEGMNLVIRVRRLRSTRSDGERSLDP
jgi:hypothetical protein